MGIINIFIDGACRPNPGKGGIGIVIRGDGWDWSLSQQCGHHKVTNNQAEYRALHRALEELAIYGANVKDIVVHSDSEMLILQMRGEKKVDRGKYVEDYLRTKKMLDMFPCISFKWIPREENSEANLLASRAIE